MLTGIPERKVDNMRKIQHGTLKLTEIELTELFGELPCPYATKADQAIQRRIERKVAYALDKME